MYTKFGLIGALVLWSCVAINVPVSAQTLEELIEKEREQEKLKQKEELKTPTLGRPEVEERLRPPTIPTAEAVALDKKIDPDEYIVGPGDQFTIYLWGQIDKPQIATVNPEGKLLVPYVGPIDVSDLSLTEAKQTVLRRVQERYRNIQVSVELSSIRRFLVYVTGQVNSPGIYRLSAVSRVLDAINNAGGLGGGASRRNIGIYRQNGDTLHADLVRFLRLGDLKTNPYVTMGDIIHVPSQGKTVGIAGAVNLPGTYEFKEGETLEDLVDLSAGFVGNARRDSTELVRFEGMIKKRLYMDMRDSTLAALHLKHSNPHPDSSYHLYFLQSDDQLYVRKIADWRPKPVVILSGAVKYPGFYAIEKGETRLLDIIQRAGGITEDAFLIKAEIVRWDPAQIADPEFERLSAMGQVQGGIEQMTDLEYAYLKIKYRETAGKIAVDFERLLLYGDPTQNIFLKHGDFITIPSKWEMVNISGEVEYPGLIPFVEGRTVTYYIAQAGGYTWNADRDKTRVIKGRTQLWLKPEKTERLEPGDTIFVPEKGRRDWWAFVKDTSAILGQMATLVIVARAIAGY